MCNKNILPMVNYQIQTLNNCGQVTLAGDHRLNGRWCRTVRKK